MNYFCIHKKKNELKKKEINKKIFFSKNFSKNKSRIITGSYDRNVIVWSFDKDIWKPSLVVLQQNKNGYFGCELG